MNMKADIVASVNGNFETRTPKINTGRHRLETGHNLAHGLNKS